MTVAHGISWKLRHVIGLQPHGNGTDAIRHYGVRNDDFGSTGMASMLDLRPAEGHQADSSSLIAFGAFLPTWMHIPDAAPPPRERLKFRTIWISDTHLGSAGCNAELLLDFLKSVECETLYLVGDIIDAWQLRKGWYWPPRHNDVVRCVLKAAKYGTRVVYVPGNHDEMLRDFVGLHFGGVEMLPEAIHTTADGRRLLVLHGDAFDSVVMYARWLAFLGDSAYTLLLKSNGILNAVRRRFGLPYWSLAAHLKKRVKNAVQFISRFEEVVAHAAIDRRVDGVVCGHIHSAEIRRFGNVVYYNDGDWVESCTALVEHGDGHIEIVDWAERTRLAAMRQRTAAGLAAACVAA